MQKQIFKLPGVEINFAGVKQAQARDLCLAVAGGREPAGEWLQELRADYPQAEIYCADKGLAYCLKQNILPDYVYGDADSAGKTLFNQAEALGVKVNVYPELKDDTDLQLLLSCLPECDLLISGVFGGRLDHLYSNIFSLRAHMQRKHKHIIMADHKEALLLLEAGDILELEFTEKAKAKLEAISLLPLTESSEVTLKGVYWPLEKAELELMRPYAISNVLHKGQKLACTCHRGKIGLYFCFR